MPTFGTKKKRFFTLACFVKLSVLRINPKVNAVLSLDNHFYKHIKMRGIKKMHNKKWFQGKL